MGRSPPPCGKLICLTPPNQTSVSRAILVGIVEDQRRTREGLQALIGGSEGFACLGAWRSMEQALASEWTVLPNVILIDLGLPGMSGIEGIAALRKRHPQMALVVLTVYEDNDRVFEALCAGASGYLLKNTEPSRLLEGLREAVSGGAPMSPEIARKVVDLFLRFRRRSARSTT
jgi:DNA-binding NarL/FixJ family response regulator